MLRPMVFGGIAVIARGVTRATQDLDLFLDPAPANIDATRRALQRVFGDPALDESRDRMGAASAATKPKSP